MKTPERELFWKVDGANSARQAKQPIKVRDRADIGLERSRGARDVGSNEKLVQREVNAPSVEVEKRIVRDGSIIDLLQVLVAKSGADLIEAQ